MRRFLTLLVLVASARAFPADKVEKTVFLAVAEPFGGPGAALAQMSRDLRDASAQRIQGILEAAEVRGRMVGQTAKASLPELDRAYGATIAMYANGEREVARRTLYGIVDDLEKSPESANAFERWERTMVRLAWVENELSHGSDAKQILERVLVADPNAKLDEDYSQPFVKLLEQVRADVNARPKLKLTVNASGRKATVFVNGHPSGEAPVTLSLARGRYRVGGLLGKLRAPSLAIELRNSAETVNLDFNLADSLRPDGGPGLALGRSERVFGILRAGAWLGVDRVLVTTTARENAKDWFVASLYDVRQGTLVREGRIRPWSGSAPSGGLKTLVKFVFNGERSGVAAAGSPAAAADNAIVDSTPTASPSGPAQP